MSNQPRGIWIITDDEPETVEPEKTGSRQAQDTGMQFGPAPVAPETHSNNKHIKAEDLKANMSEFLDVVEDAFDQAEKSRRMALEELELSIEISGEGQVRLLGSGGKAGAKGAIKLKFKRTEG